MMMKRIAVIAALAACGSPPATPRTPAGPGPRSRGLTAVEVPTGAEMECEKHDLAIRLVEGDRVLGEERIEGECHGACTPEDKAAGQQALDEANAAVDAGETESVLDYNYTDCYFTGASLARIEDRGGRQVALLVGEHPGPHDINNRYFRIAAADCGALWVSQELGATYANTWTPENVGIAATADGLAVSGQFEPGSPVVALFHVAFDPTCKSPPTETVEDAEPPM